MKKTLRSFALAALVVPMIASAQFKIETVWSNVVTDGVAHPIEGLDGGWGKPTAGNPGTATVSRFAVGKDGKMYTTSHKDNAIVSYDGTSTSIVAKLSPVTVVSWGENNTPNGNPSNLRWNGTAITTDDAGNIVFNYCFIKAASVQKWGVVNADGTVTDVDLTTPLEEIQNPTRLDIISHIVGDVTSEEGGIGYATTTGSPYVLMFHFKGDGTTMTSITAKASVEVPEIKGGGALIVPSPKHLSVKEILACKAPENEFYAPFGSMNPTAADCVSYGLVAEVNNDVVAPLTGLGNRQYVASAVFELGGKKYMVREYVDEAVMGEVFTTWKAVMTIGVFDIETSQCVASWMGSTYSNAYGMATLTAEPVDENTVNIYTWAATGSADAATGTTPGCYAAMLKLTSGDDPVVGDDPDGSEAKPYLIATAEDLCNAYKKTVVGKQVYFKQTADIDMTGVTDYVALVGFDAVWDKSIYYDGDNHIIKNFAPVERTAGVGENAYYDTSLFGTPSGTIKNLGIVDVDIKTDWIEAGVLGGFAGTGGHTATSEVVVDNVFVTGKLTNEKNPIPFGDQLAGGLFGKNGQPLKISNSYVQINIDGDTYAAGFVGKTDNNVTISNSYVSGTITAPKANFVAASNTSFPDDITLNNVVCFGEGEVSNVATIGTATVVPAGDAEGIATVQSWDAFNAGKLYNGLPALNWQDTATGISDITLDNENAPVEYYNLQGIRVNQAAAGSIVIKKQGNKTSKFIVR